MLLRMLNDPCQSETGRQMARANPQYRRSGASSQEPSAAQSRAVKSPTALGEIILFAARLTRGNVRRTRSGVLGPMYWVRRTGSDVRANRRRGHHSSRSGNSA
jgi:hypothetical protein